MFNFLYSFLSDFVRILSEMAPFLLLGFFFAGILHAFIPRESIERYFSGNKVRSSFWAALFGIPLPLCSCGVIPTGIAFFKNGASKAGTVSFLISTPQTGVDSILATFSLMGLPFALIRPIAALITGITGGIITGLVAENETPNTSTAHQQKQTKSLTEKVKDVFYYGFVEFIQDISKWLVIGLILAAAISALIPDNFFNILNLPPLIQMLLILVVSIPLYICATGSIPLAAVLLLKGLSPGAAFALLMAGPATNAATITMIGKVMGRKSLFAYLGTIILGALTFGVIIDYTLPAEWFTSLTAQQLGHNHHAPLFWWQWASAILLTLLILNGMLKKYKTTKQEPQKIDTSMGVKVIKVEGMTCNHCKMNVENNVAKLPFVKSAQVNLANKTVIIEGDEVDLDKTKETIVGLGYQWIGEVKD